MVGGAPRARREGGLCPRFTAISVAALSRTSRPSNIGRREPAPSSRCPSPRPAPARPRSSTSTRPFSADPRRIKRRTARRPEKEHGVPSVRYCLACTVPAASGLALAPPLNGGALVKTFLLHILKQARLGDLTVELLQHHFQPIALVQRDFHGPSR